jgi:hypothetical protein
MQVLLDMPAAPSSGAVTLNINGGGAVNVLDAQGNALTATNRLEANAVYLLVYISALTAWCIVGFVPAAVLPVGKKLIKSQLASSSANIDFVNGVAGVVFDDTYDSYEVECSSIVPATDDTNLQLLVGTGAGPTYQSTGYNWSNLYTLSGTAVGSSGNSVAFIALTQTGAGNAVGNAAGENFCGTIKCSNPEQTSTKMLFHFAASYTRATDGNIQTGGGGGMWATGGAAITALRFKMSSGNIGAGRFSLYGNAKA